MYIYIIHIIVVQGYSDKYVNILIVYWDIYIYILEYMYDIVTHMTILKLIALFWAYSLVNYDMGRYVIHLGYIGNHD